ncbi:hypothetical protein B0H66DRAFT_476234 [Apodospora peruviana]|uniref:Cns1/TTC4 wheel domain-containing protein n=1 Tax=Apodospora peruviana TaxID=516989 RepID=A0AAE0I631_9PEZI|nr:hypothetical protein B0H66DRAFT_476234 [Apodospora peruviana]
MDKEVATATAALNLAGTDDDNKTQNGNNPAAEPVAPIPAPALPPAHTLASKMTVEETLAELNKSPLFMTELDMDNEDVKALQALAYEGTRLENGQNFKEQGNECFREKRWSDAKEFYGKGVAILATQETKRRRRRTTAVFSSSKDDGKEEEEKEDPEEVAKERALLEQLYVNRAACHLELRNFRSCTLDCAFALRLNPRNVKALYRSSKALLAVDRIAEADDACSRGLDIDEKNAALRQLAGEIVKRHEEVEQKKRADGERECKQNYEKRLLSAALKARNITTRETGKPPDMEDAKISLVPDPSDPKSTLAFPTLLLYPLHYESDFIKAFNETESLEQHFGYVFPLPWDREGGYSSAGVECFIETTAGGLMKVGKKVPLLRVLGSGKVEVVDELVKIFVVPKAKTDAWVKDWKEKKASVGK